MRAFEFVALTPCWIPDARIAIAAARGSGIGIVDLEYIDDGTAARSAIERLSQFCKRGCGVKIDAESESLVEFIIKR
jgi:hypothetical protein